MNLDPHSALQLAFRHLDGFSVPSLGTFKRVRVMAQIDHQKKRILPPQERFVLEPGEDQLSGFEDFLFRWYNIKIDAAKEFALKIGSHLQDALQSHGQVRIDGVGLLRRDEAGEVDFVAEDGVFGQTTDFFGLQAVDYTVGESAKPSLEKKKEAAKESALANTTVVEPVKPRRKFPIGWVLFLLIIFIGAGAAWKWQAELKVVLEGYGILKSGGKDDPTDGEKTKLLKAREDSLAHARALQDSLAAMAARRLDSLKLLAENGKPKVQPKVQPKPEPKVQPKPEPKVQPNPEPKVQPKPESKVQPKPEPKPEPKVQPKPEPKVQPKPEPKSAGVGMALNDGKHGVRPVNGHFYLVVSSYENGAEAAETAKGIAGAKVLVPYYQQGFYKIAVFESTSKSQVISKMVSLKDKYPKSWIFWPGMPVSGN